MITTISITLGLLALAAIGYGLYSDRQARLYEAWASDETDWEVR